GLNRPFFCLCCGSAFTRFFTTLRPRLASRKGFSSAAVLLYLASVAGYGVLGRGETAAHLTARALRQNRCRQGMRDKREQDGFH
ncbi:MAG: hypothetical protein ABN490_11880, partial [Pantoea agglomerans]